MKKHITCLLIKRFLIICLLITWIISKATGQVEIYGATGFPEIALWDVNVIGCSCDVTQIGPLVTAGGMEVFPEGDIALCPDGTLYNNYFGELFSVDPSTGLNTSIPGMPITSESLDGLACAGGGILYGAEEWTGTRLLYKYDLNNNTLTTIGQMPYYAAAGMFMYHDSVFMFAPQGLVAVDTVNPANSFLVIPIDATVQITGATVFSSCNFAIVSLTDLNGVHKLSLFSLLDGSIFPLCVNNSSFMMMSSIYEFLPSSCEVLLDLDCNDSSGASEADYNAPDYTCLITDGAPIADEDVLLMSDVPIDQMTITITGSIPDGADESLFLPSFTPALSVSGSGTDMITITNAGGARIEDFADALRLTRYQNTATPLTDGTRTIEVQATNVLGNSSNIGTAFVEAVSLPNIIVDLGQDQVICQGESITFSPNLPGNIYQWSTGQTSPSISTSIAGEYSVTVISNVLCPNSDTVLLEVLPNVEVSLTGDPSVCENQSATITVLIETSIPIDIEIGVNPGSAIPLTGVTDDYSFTDLIFNTTEYTIVSVVPSEEACVEISDPSHTIDFNPVYEQSNLVTICEGDSVWTGDAWEKAEGLYQFTYTTVAGCDSVVFTDIDVLPREIIHVDLDTCDLTAIGTDTIELENPTGCDTLLITTIHLLPSDTTLIQKTSCAASQVGTTIAVLTSSRGCDSLIITITEYIAPDDTTFVQTITCDILQAGIYFDTLTRSDGCDSLISTQLNYQPPDTSYAFGQSCVTSEIGIFETHTLNIQGCDSLIITTITPGIPDTAYVFLFSCDSASLGLFEHHFINGAGCDSVVFTSISFSEQDSFFIQSLTCDSADVGVVVHNYTNQFGCDSIVTETVNLAFSHHLMFHTMSCDPQDTGVFVQHLINQFGCDSIVTTVVSLLISHNMFIHLTSCHPADTGVFVQYLTNQFGCDSIVTTEIELINAHQTEVQLFTCDPSQAGVTEILYVATDGCDSVVTTTTTLFPLPQVNIMSITDYHGFDISCYGGADGAIQAQVQGVDPFSYLWNNGLTNGQLDGLHAGTYVVSATDGNGCQGIDEITLNEPSFFRASFEISEPNCFEQSIGTITVLTEGGAPPYSYSLDGGPFQSNSSFTGLGEGLYEISVRDANECASIEFIHIHAPLQVHVDLGDDQVISPGDTIFLHAILDVPPDSLSNIDWEGLSQNNCDNCLTQTIFPVVSTSYSVHVVSVDGCSDEDQVTIVVDINKDIYVPNVFSPNGDGINDVLLINTGSYIKNINTFTVFDRWGNLVFEKSNFQWSDPSTGWDGKINGDIANPAVFTYRMVYALKNGTTHLKYGDVTIVR